MKKLFTLIAMVALAFGYASAATSTATESFAVADMKGLQTTNQDFTVTFGNYSLALVKNDGATAPVYNETGKDIRTYAKNTLTLTTSGAAMTKVVFKISVQGMKRLTDVAASTGSVTVDATAKTVTWTGPASEVVFTVGEKATYGSDGAYRLYVKSDGQNVAPGNRYYGYSVRAVLVENSAATSYNEGPITIGDGSGIELGEENW